MTIELVICLVISAVGAYTDWKIRKVRNWLVYPAMILGLTWSLIQGGFPGSQGALMGAALPLFLFPLFALRMLGAGDIKLLMALGAWLGPKACVTLMAFSILLGGVMALGVMLMNRNGKERLDRLWVYLKACLINRKLLPYSDFTRLGKGEALPFALAVLGGVIGLWAEQLGMISPLF